MEDIQRLRLQYVAAMAHQEVFQQQIIINQLIRGRFRWGRGAGVRRILRRRRLHPERRPNLAFMNRPRLSSEKKILEPFKSPIERFVLVSGNNIPGTGSLWIQASS